MESTWKNPLAMRLDRIRNARSETWQEFAEFLDISRQYLTLLRMGDRRPGPQLERKLREAEQEIDNKKTTSFGEVREGLSAYDATVVSQLLDQLAAENAAIKAKLAILEKKLNEAEGKAGES